MVYAWGVYEENAIEVVDHWYVLSFAYKWWGTSGKPKVCALPDYEGYTSGNSTEKLLLEDLHVLLNSADIVVAHNGRDFDVKKINARFIAQGFLPPAPYKIVDTKRDLTSVAGFSSNRLNWLSKQLGIGKKTMEHQDFEMWRGCMAGDKKAWTKMRAYNQHDVVLLEELYWLLSPWIKQPNANLWSKDAVCPNPACGSKALQARGLAKTAASTYQRFQCQKCGTWGRSTTRGKGVKVSA